MLCPLVSKRIGLNGPYPYGWDFAFSICCNLITPNLLPGSGTPKPSTPTPTNTPCSTPHPVDIQGATPSVTPTPQDSAMPQPQTLLAPFSQQQMALPVMTIPLPTSISTGTTSSQVMTNPAGLNFINVVGSVWYGPLTLLHTQALHLSFCSVRHGDVYLIFPKQVIYFFHSHYLFTTGTTFMVTPYLLRFDTSFRFKFY